MATNPSGLAGAMFDASDATNALGALSTGIGAGTNSVYGPYPAYPPNPAGQGHDVAGNGVSLARIGSAPPYGAKAQACGFPGKVVTFQPNSSGAAVASGAAMPSGGNNQSGKPCPPGGAVYAVAP